MNEALKEKFLNDLKPLERAFFLRRAKEAIERKGYPTGEDLFYYCYFLTLRERMRGIGTGPGEGYVRAMLAAGTKETDEAIGIYEACLEKSKRIPPDPDALRFIQYLSE
jgi:hypothetical protein